MLKIAHLVDDTTAGGVTRYLKFLSNDPILAALAEHRVIVVKRTRPAQEAIDADIIVSHLAISWPGLPGLMALRARHAGTPMVHVEHSYSESFTALNVESRPRFHCLLRSAYSLFDRVVAVSANQGEWLVRCGLVPRCQLEVLTPVVDLNGFGKVAMPDGPIRRIAAVGRFEPQKGFDLLIKAFKDVSDPDLALTLYGDGSQRDALVALAQGDARIRFGGFVAGPQAAYADCDLVAMPSRWEPYGLVALEANVAGRAVLMSSVDGLKDQAGRGNFVVPEFTAEAWTAAISAITQTNASLERRTCADTVRTETVLAWTDLASRLSKPDQRAAA